MRSDEKFLRENILPVLTYTANIWCTLEVDENIVTRIFLTQKFANEINANYGSNYGSKIFKVGFCRDM